MTGRPVLLVDAAEMLRVPGTRRRLRVEVDPAEVDAEHPNVGGAVVVDVGLESSIDDIAVRGAVVVPWRGVCRRCAVPVAADVVLDVDERYAEPPTPDGRLGEMRLPDDALPIIRGQFDLAGMVRDETLLAAAVDRLCRADCAGLCPDCGADLNDGPCGCAVPAADERWAALDALRGLDSTDASGSADDTDGNGVTDGNGGQRR